MSAKKPKKGPRGCVDCHNRGRSYQKIVEGERAKVPGIKGYCSVNGAFVPRKGEVCDSFRWKRGAK